MNFNHPSGVTFKEGAGDECAAAVALVLFGNSDTILPGGYAGEEISENSPINQVTEFPQELVLLGKFIYKGEIKTERGEMSILNWYLFDRYSMIIFICLSPLHFSSRIEYTNYYDHAFLLTTISLSSKNQVEQL